MSRGSRFEPEKKNSVAAPVVCAPKQDRNLKRELMLENKKSLFKEKTGMDDDRYLIRMEGEKLDRWLPRILKYGSMSNNRISESHEIYFLGKCRASKKEREALRSELSKEMEDNVLGYKDGEYYKRNRLCRLLKLI